MTARKWFCFEFHKIFDILDFGFNSSVPPPPLPVAPLRPKEIFIQRIHNFYIFKKKGHSYFTTVLYKSEEIKSSLFKLVKWIILTRFKGYRCELVMPFYIWE